MGVRCEVEENSLLQEEEETELESLLSILQDVDDSFVWWRNKFGLSVKSNYQILEALPDSDVQVDESVVKLLDMLWITIAPSKILNLVCLFFC